MSKTIEISRELLERIYNWFEHGEEYKASEIDEVRRLLAAPTCITPDDNNCPGDGVGPCKKCPKVAAPVVERQEVIDLDAVDWETIQQAADESNWMPNEYMRNEWVADVCNFLKYGRADISPPAPVAVVLPKDPEKSFLEWASTLPSPPRCLQSYLAAIDKVKELNQ